jgi:hypothetical protein
MGQKETLADFIAWGKANYPSDRTVLVIWNHGNGWLRSPITRDVTRAVSYDDETGSAINTWELAQALGNHRFDILSWDASLMQMMEVAYEVKDKADFITGSEESPPGEGLPYDLIFRRFRDNPNAPTRDLTKAYVDGMLEFPQYANRKITQSVLDTSKLDELAVAIDGLGNALSASKNAVTTAVVNARETSQAYSRTSTREYRDLVDLCQKLEAGTTVPSVIQAAAAVRAAVAQAVVWEGHNAQSPGSRGIAIDFSKGTTFLSGGRAEDYAKLRFGAETNWDEWLSTAP